MPESEENILMLTDMFVDMFKKHIQQVDYNLSINNFVLLRNALKLAAKESDLPELEIKTLESIEGHWASLSKGCGCTKDKRMKEATDETAKFASSEACKSILNKVKSTYKLNKIIVDIPASALKYEI
tara:strand:- start:19 stop:399 length:381 start_codon:yes stop_codon:yes gene_type:complete